MHIYTNKADPIKIIDGDIEDVKQFTYLGSQVNTTGGTENDIKVRISKARIVFKLLKKMGMPERSPETPNERSSNELSGLSNFMDPET